MYNLQVVSSSSDLAEQAAQNIVAQIDIALDQRERAQIALSGGKTPADAYILLGKKQLPWDRVDVFLGDERWVSPSDESSNALLIRQTLMSVYPGSEASFHQVPTVELSTPEDSAESFAEIIHKTCLGEPPVFDCMVLGLGDDGHTASLFPGTNSLEVTDQLTTVGYGKGMARISMTAPVLSAARKVIFLVSGGSKQVALKRLLDPYESPSRTPARLVRPVSEILVLADQEAAKGLVV